MGDQVSQVLINALTSQVDFGAGNLTGFPTYQDFGIGNDINSPTCESETSSFSFAISFWGRGASRFLRPLASFLCLICCQTPPV